MTSKETKFISLFVNSCINHARGKTTLSERIDWALNDPRVEFIKTKNKTIKQQRQEAEKKEKDWGNSMICQTNNGQWTTLLGEELVRNILEIRGENPRKPDKKGGCCPDWETDNFIYEVKTRNWNVSGTAGEKVLGTWIKYQNIPELYGKPLKIVCVAFQEYELTHGKIPYFGENVSEKTKSILDLAKKWNIEYIKFSDLVKTSNY